jgi:threonine aldolase
LDNARHANEMARALASAFAAHPDIALPWSVDANELFPVIPPGLRAARRASGVEFYDWPVQADMTRFVTHFAIDPAEIASTAAVIKSL